MSRAAGVLLPALVPSLLLMSWTERAVLFHAHDAHGLHAHAIPPHADDSSASTHESAADHAAHTHDPLPPPASPGDSAPENSEESDPDALLLRLPSLVASAARSQSTAPRVSSVALDHLLTALRSSILPDLLRPPGGPRQDSRRMTGCGTLADILRAGHAILV